MPDASLRYAVSWSGGKDSALALTRAAAALGPPAALLTMMIEDGGRSRSHGLRPAVLAAQARMLAVPLRTAATSWAGYESVFSAQARQLRDAGVSAIVFGDIDLEDHRAWCVRVCRAVGLDAIHPLWGEPRRKLLDEFLVGGYRAPLVAVRDGLLPPSLLGHDLGAPDTLAAIAAADVDLSGEAGEYHTVVTAMPGAHDALDLRFGETSLRDGYWFVDVEI